MNHHYSKKYALEEERRRIDSPTPIFQFLFLGGLPSCLSTCMYVCITLSTAPSQGALGELNSKAIIVHLGYRLQHAGQLARGTPCLLSHNSQFHKPTQQATNMYRG